MVNQELLAYIQNQLDSGTDKNTISQTLANSNWSVTDIHAAFAQIEKPTNTTERKRTSGWVKSFALGGIGIATLLIGANFLLSNSAEVSTGVSFTNSFPAIMKTLGVGLEEILPNTMMSLSYTKHEPPVTIGDTVLSTIASVNIKTSEDVSVENLSAVGKQVCQNIKRNDLAIDQVGVEIEQKSFLFLSNSKGIVGTCEEWESNAIYAEMVSSF